jgi:membrane-bound lytic murein transglycosylase D
MYNAGEGRVQALLARAQPKTFDRIATRLPAETQMYVPKINAALLRREGVGLAALSMPK